MRCWDTWTKDQRHERRKGAGAIRKIIGREERLLRINALKNQFSTIRSITNEWIAATGQ